MADNAWSTTPPKVPGWYWAMHREGGEWHSSPQLVKVMWHTWYKGLTEIAVRIENSNLHPSEFTHWLGPLPTPEPPTE